MDGMDENQRVSSRTDEKCYSHFASMDEAYSIGMPSARDQAVAVRASVGGWRPRRMIDIGSGTGAMLEVLSEWGFAREYAATDISELAVSFMNEHPFPGFGGAIRASADNLPYEDQSFDLATLAHVLEHVPDPIIALQEASRVASRVCVILPIELALLPKSKAILTNLNRGWGPISPMGHLHFFSVRGVRDLVRTAGLRIETEFRYRASLEWLSMNYGEGSMNRWIRGKLGSIFPIWLYGFFLSTNFAVLCSRPRSQGHEAQA